MSTLPLNTPRVVRLMIAFALATSVLLSTQALLVPARASGIEWVDGGDDSPCLNDDVGRALDALPSDQWCTPITGCYQDDDGKYVLPSRKTGIWQGDPKAVKYADELGASTPTAKPTTKPTAKAPRAPQEPTPTQRRGAERTPTAGTAPTDPLAGGEDEPVAPGAPTAPGAPVLTVKDAAVTVTWRATPDAALESVTGYVVWFTGAEPVELDATTTSHTFTDLADGAYRAAVRAVNAAGESPSSPPSDIATVGTPVAEVVGTLSVSGDLAPGASVTVDGTGFAANVPELTLELQSTPTPLGTVATDAKGSFTTTVTIPESVEAGDHSIVVLFESTEITRTPVTITSAEPTVATAAVAETVPPHAGLAILSALAAAGVLSLLWHVLRGRKRLARGTRVAEVV